MSFRALCYFTYDMTPEGEDKALVSEVPGTESTYEINVVGEDTYDGDEKNPITEDEGLSSAMKLLDNLGISGFACTETEEVKLLSWDEMIKAAGESIAKYYKDHPTNYGTVEFNDVELAYVPCADESGNKYFVPTWIFSQNEYN